MEDWRSLGYNVYPADRRTMMPSDPSPRCEWQGPDTGQGQPGASVALDSVVIDRGAASMVLLTASLRSTAGMYDKADCTLCLYHMARFLSPESPES